MQVKVRVVLYEGIQRVVSKVEGLGAKLEAFRLVDLERLVESNIVALIAGAVQIRQSVRPNAGTGCHRTLLWRLETGGIEVLTAVQAVRRIANQRRHRLLIRSAHEIAVAEVRRASAVETDGAVVDPIVLVAAAAVSVGRTGNVERCAR